MNPLVALLTALLLALPAALVGADAPQAQVPSPARYILLNVHSPTRQVLEEIRAAVPPPVLAIQPDKDRRAGLAGQIQPFLEIGDGGPVLAGQVTDDETEGHPQFDPGLAEGIYQLK